MMIWLLQGVNVPVALLMPTLQMMRQLAQRLLQLEERLPEWLLLHWAELPV
jgi:hypothetical protein